MTSKADLVWEIAIELGVEAPKMSTGSTEPREIFDLVNDVFGLGLEANLTKPEIARQIVEATGTPWLVDYESSGGTVTKKGLSAVRDAVNYFVGK